jgi:hypothetical protein
MPDCALSLAVCVALATGVVERPPLVLAALDPVLPTEPELPLAELPLAELPLAELPLPVAELPVREVSFVSFPTLLFDSMNYPPCRMT